MISVEDSIITFLRESTQKRWKMNLKDVHKAYQEIKDFKNGNSDKYNNLVKKKFSDLIEVRID